MNARIPSRISALRDALREHDVQACLVPSADPHLSEYLPDHWQARQWLSGFDGSAGTLVVTADFAGLWTDSRYFEQAEQQLADTGVTLMRLRVPHTAEHVDWLLERLGEGDTLAVAGDSMSLSGARMLRKRLEKIGAHLRTDLDLPGAVWSDRPALPQAPVRAQAEGWRDGTCAQRIARLRESMQAAGASHHLVSSLDDIAWITGLRGSDVEYNPVFLAHLLVEPAQCTLFVDPTKIDAKLSAQLQTDGIVVRAYADTVTALNELPSDARVLLDPARVVVDIVDALPDTARLIERANPSTAFKAIKSAAEIEHIRATMREDGAALVQGMREIERRLQAGETVSELDVADVLREKRSQRPAFVGESFGTIAGYMANGALPHYHATPEHHAQLHADGLLLVDSGGQYEGGTTDITRMWAFGETTPEQRRDCSLVLKGTIALSRARFPAGSSGPQLDALARAPIWAEGGDYGHGTGHGVGYFLNVHEGPHGIRPPAPGGALVPLEPCMITSIEPGLYKSGRHGVRHENLAVVRTWQDTEFGSFLEFETLTLCPIDTRALDVELLDDAERAWLNDYHARVEKALSPLLDDEDRRWLQQRCAPV
ncbi:aminopeptidase P family protein [Oleiagrimonas soli]|uniref:Peptidase M24 n=1 Tax=Oleiagrimonas soli TaxID=1543381 RepID=A0A099CUD9_9GAMM|nr:aminopeptidase P family protein [Oleiagrimonas soli]KGI77528.1 peptidase M24 [Oleiagrimonas soli]MBB6183001.1 Xaa-Pro aminopeptidase [Oleiagrimonas soli]